MKKKTVVLLALVLSLALAVCAQASSLDSLKTTLTLGPFQIRELGGFVLKQTETSLETVTGLYNLQSAEHTGITDAEAVAAMAEKVKQDYPDMGICRNSHGLDGLWYAWTSGGSNYLTFIIIHGSDALIAVLSLGPDTEITSHYAEYLMEDYSLVGQD